MPPGAADSADWSRERTEALAERICDAPRIEAAVAESANASPSALRDILHAARALQGRTRDQAAALIQVRDPDLRAEILDAAGHVHQQVFARRISLSVPICPTNRCVNDCAYCPLRRSNARLRRTTSSTREIQREVAALLGEGHCHVTMVHGDDRSGVQYLRDLVWAAYGVRSNSRQMQRIDLNINPMSVPELRELTGAHIAVFHVYQETYHRETYQALHHDGVKADFAWRLTGHDRAHQAGLSNAGLGLLLGAYDFRFDVPALLAHAQHLRESYGVGPQAITYPVMLPVPGAPVTRDPAHKVSDEDFIFVVAVTRLASPYTSIVMATPAPTEVRRTLYGVGVSEVSVGSLSYPGVYTADGDPAAAGNLVIGRPRGLENLVYRICEAGFVPNLCAACYTQTRREADPERTRRPSHTSESCGANALLALKDYLMDFASPDTQTVGGRLIQAELARLAGSTRALTLELMEEAEAGLRGLSM